MSPPAYSTPFPGEGIYVDQAPYHTQVAHWSFGAVYTPYGIADLDEDFSQRIQHMTTSTEATTLEQEIRDNLHLHQRIKDNLLENLTNFRALLPIPEVG